MNSVGLRGSGWAMWPLSFPVEWDLIQSVLRISSLPGQLNSLVAVISNWYQIPLHNLPLRDKFYLINLIPLCSRLPKHNNQYITLLEKYPTLFIFRKLVEFNETRLNKLTLNLQTYAWIFFRLSIVLVYGKKHLSEVVFSALVKFSLYGKLRFPRRTLYFSPVLWFSRSLGHSLWSPACPLSPGCTGTP